STNHTKIGINKMRKLVRTLGRFQFEGFGDSKLEFTLSFEVATLDILPCMYFSWFIPPRWTLKLRTIRPLKYFAVIYDYNAYNTRLDVDLPQHCDIIDTFHNLK